MVHIKVSGIYADKEYECKTVIVHGTDSNGTAVRITGSANVTIWRDECEVKENSEVTEVFLS
jgi:hypothetical protein